MSTANKDDEPTSGRSGSGDESNPKTPWKPRGYPRLAGIMGMAGSTVIFRKFGQLNMFNLLSLQAQLLDLEAQLQEQWKVDDGRNAPEDTQKFAICFGALHESRRSQRYKRQWELLNQARPLLDQYNKALLQVAAISKFHGPDDLNLGTLTEWLERKSGGNDFLDDAGIEAETWKNKDDLIALVLPDGEQDLFTTWVVGKPLSWFHRNISERWYHLRARRKAHDEEKGNAAPAAERELYHDRARYIDDSGMVIYTDEGIKTVCSNVATLIALCLPLAAVIVLYVVKNTPARIGIMVAFTAVFALALGVFTTAQRIEVFGATAAFAAIEVVFIGSVSS